MHPWYVLPVLSQHELRLEKKIRELKYEAMSPWDTGQRRIRGLYRPWRFPLYTGYVFVQLADPTAGWDHLDEVFNTAERRLVYKLLRKTPDAPPAILRPADVEYLQSIADGRYKNEAKYLVVGDTVLVPDGHLQGRASVITKIKLSKKRGIRATVKVIGEKNDVKQEFPLAKLVKV